MQPELTSTLQQLLKFPQEEEVMPEQIANTETSEEVKGRIHQLLAKANYKYVKERKKCSLMICVGLETTIEKLKNTLYLSMPSDDDGRYFHCTTLGLTKGIVQAGHWCLMPVILATWEAKMGRIKIQGQPH
jgi:hypothetical protein